MELNKKTKKLYYFFRNPVYKLYCFIFRPKSLGVKVIVENDKKFLMVRIGYAHKKFTFPGGGVEKNESFEEAAKRELEEETGIKTQQLTEIGEYTSDRNYKKNIVKCFYLKTDSSFIKIDNFEIIEADWYSQDQFPKDRSSSVAEIFGIYENFKAKHI
jgi:8-oxo-dGTP pyrophosphatase MutT (NUDIX family)